VSLILPPPGEKLVAPNGGMNETWYTKFAAALSSAAAATTGLAGLGTAAAKNVGTSGDTVPLCNTVNAWSKQQYFPLATLTEAEALAGWDLDTKQSAKLTMTSSFTLAAALNAKPGATYQLGIDAGAHVLGFDAAFYKFPAGGAIPTTVGKCLFSFWAWSATELWCVGVKEFA
jgi:hypothetical protein